MPYIGRELDRGNYLKLDDISSSFDGSTTTFNLTNGGNAFYPGSAFSILVVLAGVVQEPEAAYQINQAQITFASAPLAGDQFFCIVLGQALGVNTPANGSVNGTQLAKPFNYDNYFYLNDTTNRVGVGTATPMTPLHVEGTGRFTNVTVTGDLTVEGTTTTLDTVVTEVDKLEVAANNSTVGVAITQSGTGDILRLYDGASQKVTVTDTGEIGIGINSPSQLLHVNNPNSNAIIQITSSDTNKARVRFGDQTSNNGGEVQYDNADDSLAFKTVGSEKVRITSGGILQVGASHSTGTYGWDPTFKVAVEQGGGDPSAIHFGESVNGSANPSINFLRRDGSTLWSAYAGQISYELNKFQFKTSPNAAPGSHSYTTRMTILQGGNVGIGSDTPQSQFEVHGTSPIIRSKHSTSQKYTQINHNGTDGYLDWSSGELIFRGASNAERLRIDSNGLVGIGTDNPVALLNPHGTAALTNADQVVLISDSNADDAIGRGGNLGFAGYVNGSLRTLAAIGGLKTNAGNSFNGDLGLYTRVNGQAELVERLRITYDGHIGIGVTNPSSDLEISQDGSQKIRIYKNTPASTPASNGNNTTVIDFIKANSGSSTEIGAIRWRNTDTDSSNTEYTAASIASFNDGAANDGNLVFNIANNGTQAEALRITSTGSVGIGTDNPNNPLTIHASGNHIYLKDTATDNNLQIRSSGGVSEFNSFGTGGARRDFIFNQYTSEVLRITSAGRVGIGITNPGSLLHISGADANAAKIKIEDNNNGFAASEINVANGGRDLRIAAPQDIYFQDVDTGEEHLYIESGGNVGIGTDNPLNGLDVNQSEGRLRVNRFSHLLMQNKNDSTTDYWGISARNGGELDIGYGTPDGNSLIGGDKLTITSSGDVGIGTATPDKKLRVEGDARITGTLTIGEASTAIDGGVEYPSFRPTLDLNFAGTKVLDDRIAFTRDSLGTYVDDMGIIKYSSNNTPRFDHDPDTTESLGLLIEESRTNLLTYSDLVSGEGLGTGWAIGGSRASKGSNATAPDGTLSAWNSVYNGTGGDASLYKNGGEVTTSNSTEHTLSIFAKVPSTNTYITGVRIRTFNNNHSATFNLLNGTIVGTAEGTTTNRIEAYPNGWYRCSITFTSGTDGNQGVQFYMTNPSNNTSLNDSNANGEEIHYWGAQLEEGRFATSYIPTSGSTVTRAADYAKITGTNFTDFYNSKESAVSVRFNMYGYTGSGFNRVYEISDGTTNNRHSFLNNGTNSEMYESFNISGSNEVGTVSDTITFGNFYNYTESFKNNDYQRYLNVDGTFEEHTDSSIPIDNFSPTQIIFGGHLNSSAAGILNGHISYFKYYPKRLPNAQLQGLTQQ